MQKHWDHSSSSKARMRTKECPRVTHLLTSESGSLWVAGMFLFPLLWLNTMLQKVCLLFRNISAGQRPQDNVGWKVPEEASSLACCSEQGPLQGLPSSLRVLPGPLWNAADHGGCRTALGSLFQHPTTPRGQTLHLMAICNTVSFRFFKLLVYIYLPLTSLQISKNLCFKISYHTAVNSSFYMSRVCWNPVN